MKGWRLVSYVLHPLWIPSLAMWLVMQFNPSLSMLVPLAGRLRLVAFVFVFTGLIPGVTVWYMKRFGLVASLELPDRGQRRLPLLVGSLSFSAAYYLLRQAIPFPVIDWMMLSGMMLMALSLLITLFYKISMHLLAWGALTGQLLSLGPWHLQGFLLWFSLAMVCSGLVASSRLALNAHKGHELFVGFALGFLVPLAMFQWLL